MAVCEVTLGSGEAGKAIELLVALLQLQQKQLVSLQQGNELKVIQKEQGTKLCNLGTISRYLCSLSPEGSRLLGDGSSQQTALVSEWTTYAANYFQSVTDDVLSQVSQHLQNKVYLTGSQLTLPDILLFTALHDSMVLVPAAQTHTFCSLLRWFDLLQNTIVPDNSTLEKVVLKKPRFCKPIYQKVELEETKKAPPSKEQQDKPKDQKTDKKKDEKLDKKVAEKKANVSEQNKQGKSDEVRIDQLDIRIGKIVKIEQHPNADGLYLEQIDLGEEKPRQVISGLVKFVPLEKMMNRKVVVITNLKPAKMRDILSSGMVLCASNDDHTQVDPLLVPDEVEIGEKVKIEGYDNEPDNEINNAKKKTLDKIFPDLKTNDRGVANYKGVALMTSKGALTSPLVQAWVR